MTRRMFILWAVAAWITPAVVGGAVGWPGIWGGGSAFGDLILPVPITGGIIHVPTFIAAVVLARVYPSLPANSASLLRAGLLGAAFVGLAHLVDLERIYLGSSTDLTLREIPFQRSYLGLCLMTDSLWTFGLTFKRPKLDTLWLPALALIVLPPVAYVYAEITGNERLNDPFLYGRNEWGPDRGGEIFYVYARLSPSDPAFRAAARDFLIDYEPSINVNVEELAVYFTDSLRAARSPRGEGIVRATLCLYEDGAPDRWAEGEFDCFTEHTSFTERREVLSARQPVAIPDDVWTFAVSENLCRDVEIPTSYADGIAAVYYCRQVDLETEREALTMTRSATQLEALLQRAREALEG